MRINIRMSFDCLQIARFSFFVCAYMEKDIRRSWFKPPYVGLHLDLQLREPIYLKIGEIDIILLKKVLLFTKSVTTMSA